MSIWETIAEERHRLADELETLTDEQWQAQSQCEHWTVGEMATHVILPFEVSTPRFVLTMARYRGDLSKTAINLTARVHGRNTRTEVIAKLRAHADNKWTPPRLGPEIPLSEVVVHGQDIRRPLGMPSTIPDEVIDLTLEGIDDADIRADYSARIGR